MILVWGLPRDGPVRAVLDELAARGARVAFLDQHDALLAELELECGANTAGRLLLAEGEEIDMADVRAAYLRPDDARLLPAVERARQAGGDWERAVALQDALLAWADVTPALVASRPSAMASNSSKPYQAALLRKLGFRVPETLVTTDPAAARAFWHRHGDVIYKSVSGVRSIVTRLGEDHVARLDDVAHCPTQFQRWIPGVDHRVHVVGGEVFACTVHCEADDYRYAAAGGHTMDVAACALPADLVSRCREAAHALGLPVAGIDLRRTPDGEWLCFEMNPSPGFTYYDDVHDGAIAQAVAGLLEAADRGATRPAS